MSYKVWVIGLDGATFDLILPWVEAGYLPTLSRLLREGAWGEVRSTIPPITGPAWSTFMTGTNPGSHGVFDWVQQRKASYDFEPVTHKNIRQPSFWSLASAAGKRVIVLNVPMTFPPEKVNGIIVSGIPATSLSTYPNDLATEILQQIPDYDIYPDPGQAYSDQGIETFLLRLHKANEGLMRLWRLQILREKWDFAMLVFNATDVVQHAMWKYMSPEHPLYNPKGAERFGNAILNVYQEMDNFLGEIIDSMDQDTVLWVMSDHGFGPLYKFIHVNIWLMQEGLLKINSNPKAYLKSVLFRFGLSPMPIYDLMMRIGLGKLKREVVRGRGRGLMQTFFLSFNDVDWSNTVAYSMGNVGQIRINLLGREPQGCIQPGEEYEKTVNDIINRLKKLQDPATKEKVIESVYRRSEVYHGEAKENGADILFIPRRLEYFGFGEYEFGDHRVIAKIEHGISGTHRMNGISVVWGKPILATKFQGAKLEDIAPTILHLLGLSIPSHIDGRILLEILSEEANLNAPKIGQAFEVYQSSGDGLNEEDEQILRQRLRDLGYVA